VKADLYLFNSSFIYKDEISLNVLRDNLRELQITIQNIKENSVKFQSEKDQVFKYEGIYEITIFKDVTIAEFLYNNIISFRKLRDEKKFLMKILDHSIQSNLTEEEILDILRNDSNNLRGLLYLHSIYVDKIDNKLIVKTKEHWYNFHRHFLSKNPVDELNFYSESQKYFTNIYFHPDVEKTLRKLDGGLEKFAETIVYNLTQLNDNFSIYNSPSDRIGTLRKFSSICGVNASPEGNASRKSSLTFEFNDENSNPMSICCEPHLKLSKADMPGDTHFYYNRIYFHEGKPNVEGGRILVAHIGKHL
jgi:hypothetical protein